MPSPDLAGFLASRNVLFDNFGVPVVFLIPVAPTWDPSIPLDEEGQPLDPFASPLTGGEGVFTEVPVTVSLVTRPFGGRGQVRDQTVGVTPVGRIADQELGLILRPADYARVGETEPKATHVSFWDTQFEVREWRADGVGALQRYVCYITQEGGPDAP